MSPKDPYPYDYLPPLSESSKRVLEENAELYQRLADYDAGKRPHPGRLKMEEFDDTDQADPDG